MLFFLLVLWGTRVYSEDARAQYPALLSNSYFRIESGFINYPFSNALLKPGFHAESIEIPHLGIRISFGHYFNTRISAQISYAKPLSQVVYRNINADGSNHSVWMHAGAVTLRSRLFEKEKFSVYGEGGLALVTRRGFQVGDSIAVRSTSFANVLAGAGVQYRLNDNWDLIAAAAYLPARKSEKQPYTVLFSGGFAYTMRPLPPKQVKESANSPFVFPENLLQFGYTTNALGYGLNNFVSKKPFDIFWGGMAEVAQGFWLRYQRNIFHTRKFFSLDEGISVGFWKSRTARTGFYTLSAFPTFRFTVVHSQAADFYFNYSVAGPSFISRIEIDGQNTGRHFTFQDFMGVGVFMGKTRNVNLEIGINHYSNGNIFPENAAVKIPLTFNLGYTF